MKFLALVAVLCFSSVAFCQPICTVNYAVASQDTLKNLKFGLSPKDVEWANGLQKKYPGVCYMVSASQAHVVLSILVTPDTYHGTQTVTDTATTTSETDSTVHLNTTSSHEEPYSLDYGIYTLVVERIHPDGSVTILQTFQQKGLYRQIYGIPLEKRGYHPAHAVIEDAVKWLSAGGLTDPNQGSNLIPDGVKP